MFFNDPEFAVEPHDIAPIKEFLLEALARKDRGDSGNYDVIVEQLEKRNDEEVLWKLLVGLCSCVSQLTNRTVKYQQLIQAIFGYNWTCNQKITSAYLNLLGYLVSSNATFLIPCFQFIVKSFGDLSMIRQSAQSLNGLDDNKSISSLLDNPIDIETEQKFERIHRTLFGIIQLAPTGQAELFPMLAQFFPHKRFSVDRLSGYVQHLLRICEYLPVLQPKILDLIVLKCLEVDVEIVIEDSGEVKIQEEYDGENADEMFLLDEEPDNGKNGSKYLNGSSQRSQNEHAGQRIPAEVAELADKLDALLVLFLQYIDKCVGTGEASERLFHQLLYTFEERVLVTHRSKFVQFVLFYFAGRSDRFSRALAGRLLRCFLDNASTPLKQQSAVLYLGSFLSRATFLPMSVISETIAELLHWCSHYLTQVKGDSELSSSLKPSDSLRSPQDSDKGSYIKALLSNPLAASSSSASTGSTTSSASSNSDKQITSSPPSSSSKLESPQALRSIPLLRRRTDATCHETFYYCMQAVLYVYCFHGTDLVAFDSTNGTTKYSRITMQHLERCIVSSLDPLRFCLASVRTEFLRLALHTGMLSAVCVGGISKDLLPSGDGNASASNNDGTAGSRAPIKIVIGQPGRRTVARSLSAGANPLDTFFPFDPCLLRYIHFLALDISTFCIADALISLTFPFTYYPTLMPMQTLASADRVVISHLGWCTGARYWPVR